MASSLRSLALYCYRQSSQDSPQFTPVLPQQVPCVAGLVCVFCDCNTQVMIYGPLHAVGCSLCNLVVSHFVYRGSDSPWYDCHGHWWESKMICEESWIRNHFLHLRLLFPISDILCAWSKICMMALSLPRNFDRTCDIDVICVLWRYGCTCMSWCPCSFNAAPNFDYFRFVFWCFVIQ